MPGKAIPPAMRTAVWERDQGICGICHEPVDPLEWNADHILPWVLGGETVVHNLRVTHPRCNRKRPTPLRMTDEQIQEACEDWTENELAGVWMTFEEFTEDPAAAIAHLRESGKVDPDILDALEKRA